MDLRGIDNICVLKKILCSLKQVEKRVFLVEDSAHLSVSQAYALGATVFSVGALIGPMVGGARIDVPSMEIPARF